MGQMKSGPAGVDAPVIPGLTANKERLMSNRINPESDHKATCRVFLELAAQDLANAMRTRNHYVGLANKYGLSNVDIGECLGVSETRVRQILADGV